MGLPAVAGITIVLMLFGEAPGNTAAWQWLPCPSQLPVAGSAGIAAAPPPAPTLFFALSHLFRKVASSSPTSRFPSGCAGCAICPIFTVSAMCCACTGAAYTHATMPGRFPSCARPGPLFAPAATRRRLPGAHHQQLPRPGRVELRHPGHTQLHRVGRLGSHQASCLLN